VLIAQASCSRNSSARVMLTVCGTPDRCAGRSPWREDHQGSCRPLGLVDDADMRGNDAPPFCKAYPGLHLPAHLARQGVAIEQRRGHGHVAAVRGDDGARGPAHQPDRRARGAEGSDLMMTVKVLDNAVTQRARVPVEELIEHGDVVADQRLLVALELRG